MKRESKQWKNEMDVFEWWMEDETIKGQVELFDLPDWKAENPP